MSEKDVLISRIVDRADGPEDWVRFDQLAARDRSAYDSLIATLRDESLLRTAVAPRLAVAEQVDLRPPGFFARHPWVPQWSGWMAVAGLLLAWMVSEAWRDVPTDTAAPIAGARGQRDTAQEQKLVQIEPDGAPRTDESPSELLQVEEAVESLPEAQLAGATVLQGLPNLMVHTQPIAGSDKTEVFYVRRTLERAVIGTAYALSRDEMGRPVHTGVDLSAFTMRRSY